MKANLLPLLGLLLLAQCKKREPDPTPPTPADPVATLPAETQTGAGTFGCLVNGKAMSSPNSLHVNGDWQSFTKLVVGGTIYIDGKLANNWQSVSLPLNGQLSSNQNFSIIPSTAPYPIFTPNVNQFFVRSTGLICFYSGGYIKTGQVTLTKFDGPARIASGRFAFTLYEPGGCDTLKVTNGRFDVKF